MISEKPFRLQTYLPVRSIARVRDCRPGVGGEMIRAVSEVLDGLDAPELAELRQDVQKARRDGKPLFRCEFCGEPVHVRVTGVAHSGVTGGRRASFAHDPRKGRPPCPYRTYSCVATRDGRRDGATGS